MPLSEEWLMAGIDAVLPYVGEIKSEPHRQQTLANARADTERILRAVLPLVVRDLLHPSGAVLRAGRNVIEDADIGATEALALAYCVGHALVSAWAKEHGVM